jgi:NCS1 family nucleobase:cation symporter-1
VHGLIPALKPLYDYSWVVGFVTAILLYVALSTAAPQRQLAGAAAPPRPAGAAG